MTAAAEIAGGLPAPGSVARPTIAAPLAFRDEPPEAVDVAIIGAGVIGVFTALYLARAGKRVFLCEKGRVAGEQSSRNWGWIRQQNRDEGELPVMTHALRLWSEVDAELKGACGFVQCGVTYLAETEKKQAEHERFLKIAQAHGLDTRILSKTEATGLFEGRTGGRWLSAMQTLSDARGEPWAAVPAVARLARAEGALIREDCAVRALDISAGRVTGIITEDGPVRAEEVVLAGGAWSSLFARNHGVEMPQLTVRATAAATAPLPQFFNGAVADGHIGLRRRADGGYTIAITDGHGFYLGPDAFRRFFSWTNELRRGWRDITPSPAAPAGFPDAWGQTRRWSADEVSPFEKTRVLEPPPDMNYVRRAQDRFAERFPEIGRPEIRAAWAGMIDAMPDIVPIVDRVPALPGLIVATGMSGHGFGIGPGFGHAIARMITGEAPEHDLSRFRFSRFSDGSPLKPGPAL